MAAFETGDPATVYQAALGLVSAYRDLRTYSAKLRFHLNFGSAEQRLHPRWPCRNCDGLKAGPGVVATCYQVELCNFTNIKDTDQNPRHLRVLDNLTSDLPRKP